MSDVDSILLIGFGAPRKQEQVLPFLEGVVRGRGVPRERLEEVAHHYEAIGGRSPYNDFTFQQAPGTTPLGDGFAFVLHIRAEGVRPRCGG